MRDIYLIIADDGTRLHCEAKWFGPGSQAYRYRWAIHTTEREFVGPIALRGMTPIEVRDTILAWWDTKELLGQDV